MKHASLLAAAALLGISPLCLADTVALSPNTSSGSQSYDNLFGMDFNTNSAIQVTQLGVFDNGADGTLNTDSPSQPIVIQLWDLNNPSTALATVNFGGGASIGTDTAVGAGKVFFQPLAAPLSLPSGGNYYISEDYSSAEQFFNSGGDAIKAPTVQNSGGLISFVGSGRASFGHGYVYPSGGSGFLDQGPAARYAGPDFQFVAAPEPASLGLLGVAGIGLLARRRRA